MFKLLVIAVLLPTIHSQLLPTIHSQLPPNQALVNFTQLFGTNPRCGRSFEDLATYDGYRVEKHYVITSDGYILTLFHIFPHISCTVIKLIHVLFMHGLYLSGIDCLVPGPKKAICYILADACYHVWVGNNRGNVYSRNHTIYNPNTDKIFWRFDYEDMARKDMPAIIDFILIKTGTTQIFFVGHSQGMACLILCLSFYGEYNAKIKFAIGLSTSTWLYHARLIVLTLQAILATENILSYDGEIFPYGGIVQSTADACCATSNISYPGCAAAVFALFGCDITSLSPDTIAVAVSVEPSGTSIEDFLKWGHTVLNGFGYKDYGTAGNLEHYKSIIPPTYDLSNYTAKTTFVYSDGDYICDEEDLKILISNLVNDEQIFVCKLSDDTFCHVDYIYSNKTTEYIYPILLAAFDNDTYVCT
ncbi:lipase 3-like [Anticarsia gemmatalis]|uniref:lipase 3-like n=1 Tax=Anticarsia gemmatalis TaxID=129554 RepID=UPI003F774C05